MRSLRSNLAGFPSERVSNQKNSRASIMQCINQMLSKASSAKNPCSPSFTTPGFESEAEIGQRSTKQRTPMGRALAMVEGASTFTINPTSVTTYIQSLTRQNKQSSQCQGTNHFCAGFPVAEKPRRKQGFRWRKSPVENRVSGGGKAQ